MAYHKPQNIDDFVLLMTKADMRVKAQLAEDLVAYLNDMENSIVSNDLGLLVDNLMPWLMESHFKIAQRALEAFTELIGRLGQDFSAYTPTMLPRVVDRLGDSRETVREKAQLLLFKLMESRVLLPQELLDKLIYCFKHKNSKIREEFLQTVVSTLKEYGTQSLSVEAYIQPIVSLLGDPTSTVRDAAIQTLVEIYKHVGDKLRIDLRKKDIDPTKMAALEHKFDEVRQDGLLLPSALRSAIEPDSFVTQQQQQQQASLLLVEANEELSLEEEFNKILAESLGDNERSEQLAFEQYSSQAPLDSEGVNSTKQDVGNVDQSTVDQAMNLIIRTVEAHKSCGENYRIIQVELDKSNNNLTDIKQSMTATMKSHIGEVGKSFQTNLVEHKNRLSIFANKKLEENLRINDELRQINIDLDNLKLENARLKEELSMKELLTGNENAQIKLYEQKDQRMTQQIEIMTQQIEIMTHRLNSLEIETKSLRTSTDLLTSEVVSLRSEVVSLRSEVVSLRSEVVSLRSRISVLEANSE